MSNNLLKGCSYLATGFKLIGQPKLRRFVLVPLTINISLFLWVIYYSFINFSGWLESWFGWLPDWLGFIDWILWPLFSMTILAAIVFSFTFVANFIAAPFNGFLADAVQQHLTGITTSNIKRSLGSEVMHSLERELQKVLWYLPKILLLFVISWVPLVNIIAPVLWLLFGAWVMAVQYLDYPMDNNNITFNDMLIRLNTKRYISFGLGGGVMLLSMIPLINFVVIPAAVAGSVACWVDKFQHHPISTS